VWFVDVVRDGETLELCVRGERVDAQIGFPLHHELRFQQLLEAHGIPVAQVHGWCPEPRAIVMERVPGRPDFAESSDAERHSVMDDYIGILARLHALEVAPFADAGILRADRPGEAGRVGLQRYERSYRAAKKRPDPFLEFCLAWLARNPLPVTDREAPILWDSGQFHHRKGRIVALMDLELGHLGDPMMDLAGFRMRDTEIGYGDLRTLYARYAELTGEGVDIAAVQHHHLAFALTNQLAFHAALAEPPPGSDYMMNLRWCSETNLFAVEALAEILGIELEDADSPEPRSSPVGVAHQHLVRWLRGFEAGDGFGQHEVRNAFRLARHLARFDEVGDALGEADLEDLGPLLGRRPASWQEGDAELERFVLADDGRHDAELVQLFHRRLQRGLMLLGPAGSAMTRHHPIQRFAD
jgi:aminoglycoside phosphotransferase (APT) family kinase protein